MSSVGSKLVLAELSGVGSSRGTIIRPLTAGEGDMMFSGDLEASDNLDFEL